MDNKMVKFVLLSGSILIQLLGAVVASSGCPGGWLQGRESFKEFCYLNVNKYQTFSASEDHCLKLGAHLASFHSQSEYDFIWDEVRVGDYTSPWVGLSRTGDESSWTWTDGTSVDFVKWGHRSKLFFN